MRFFDRRIAKNHTDVLCTVILLGYTLFRMHNTNEVFFLEDQMAKIIDRNRKLLFCSVVSFATCFITLAAISATADTLRVDRNDDEGSASQCSVMSLADCSLRGAILFANLNSGEDTIVVPAGTYYLSIPGTDEDFAASGDLDIRDDLVIKSFGGEAFINAAAIDRVFEIFEASTVEMTGLSIIGGYTLLDGGCVLNKGSLVMADISVYYCTSKAIGGGIANRGSLTITNGGVRNNYAVQGGGISHANGTTMYLYDSSIGPWNVADGPGGGIWSDGELYLFRTVVYNNEAGFDATASIMDDGGGVYNDGGAYFTNCTITNNTSPGYGGGVFSEDYVVFDLTTLSANSAVLGSEVFIWEGMMSVRSTLIHGGCYHPGPTTIYSAGGNLESPGNSCELIDSSDQVNVADPGLGVFDFHGGRALSFNLLPWSPAIDAAHVLCSDHDQRNHDRPIDGNASGDSFCDVGSYEFNSTELFSTGFEQGDSNAWSSTNH